MIYDYGRGLFIPLDTRTQTSTINLRSLCLAVDVRNQVLSSDIRSLELPVDDNIVRLTED